MKEVLITSRPDLFLVHNTTLFKFVYFFFFDQFPDFGDHGNSDVLPSGSPVHCSGDI